MNLVQKLAVLLGLLVPTFLAHGWLFWVGLSACTAYFIIGSLVYHNIPPWRRIYFVPELGGLLVLWALTSLAHGWRFWVDIAVSAWTTYFILGNIIYHNITPWRTIYFPLINRYAFLGGVHVEIADLTQTEFSPLKPIYVLLKEYLGDVQDNQLQEGLRKWKDELDTFQCQEIFCELLSQDGQNPLDARERVEGLRRIMFDPRNYNGYLVRYVIGQVIEMKLGPEQKKKYWRAVLSGQLV